jgi:hypothetical protein
MAKNKENNEKTVEKTVVSLNGGKYAFRLIPREQIAEIKLENQTVTIIRNGRDNIIEFFENIEKAGMTFLNMKDRLKEDGFLLLENY